MHPEIQPNDGVSFSIFRVLLFHHTIILLMQPFGAPSELICSHQPIVALAGDDVILQCHLEPPTTASSETVVWTKPGLDPKYIHVHKDGRLVFEHQNPSYNYRTRLFVDELTNGNVSMKIFSVKISDAGKYFCVVSTPIIEVVSNKSGSVVLQCESKGWYPEPEVLWLDGEGNLLSAGPTETVRGPDDLYTVSSRVTVEERHSNNFTCRVQQKNINQIRETHIHVPADFTLQSSSHWTWSIALGSAVLVLAFFILKIRNYIKRKREMQNFRNEADGQELSRLTEQEEGLENQRATGEGTKRNQQHEHEQKEEEKDGQQNVNKEAFVIPRKPKVMKKHNGDFLILKWKKQEDQRELLDVKERSQTEGASGAGNNNTRAKRPFKIQEAESE